MTDILNIKNFPSSLYSNPKNPDSYFLTIEFSAKQLAEFIAPHIDALNLEKIAKAEKRTSAAKENNLFKKEQTERRKSHLATGKSVHKLQVKFKAQGIGNKEAWNRAAKDCDLSLFNAQLFARFYRVELKKQREIRLIKLYSNKKSNSHIAKSLGVSNSITIRMIRQLRKDGRL